MDSETEKYIKELEFTLLDLLDGQDDCYEIEELTGLSIERSMEIEKLLRKIRERCWNEWLNDKIKGE